MSNYLDRITATATDNMWTSASADELLPGIHRILETMPPHPAHFLWLNWGPSPQRQDMAYSLEDEIYLALYAGWSDAADDAEYARLGAIQHGRDGAAGRAASNWPTRTSAQRPAPFVTDDNMAKLDRVRAAYDPDGRFHPWMGRV